MSGSKQPRTPKATAHAARQAASSTRRGAVVPKKPARPFQHSSSIIFEIWDEILDQLTAGRGLKRICRENPQFPNRITILRAIAGGTDEQRNTYARACEDGADAMVEEAMDIADDGLNDTYLDDDGKVKVASDVIQRSKLRVEQRRWHAGKLKPKKYGEKLDVTSDHKPLAGADARGAAAALLAQAAELRARLGVK